MSNLLTAELLPLKKMCLNSDTSKVSLHGNVIFRADYGFTHIPMHNEMVINETILQLSSESVSFFCKQACNLKNRINSDIHDKVTHATGIRTCIHKVFIIQVMTLDKKYTFFQVLEAAIHNLEL